MMIPLLLRVLLMVVGFERSMADLLAELLSFLWRIIG
jgi:hypothetical protein